MLLCPRKDATSDTVAVVRAVFLVDLSVVHSSSSRIHLVSAGVRLVN